MRTFSVGKVHIKYHILNSSNKQIGKAATLCHMYMHTSFSVMVQYWAFPVNLGFANQPEQKHVLTSHKTCQRRLLTLSMVRRVFLLKDFCQVSDFWWKFHLEFKKKKVKLDNSLILLAPLVIIMSKFHLSALFADYFTAWFMDRRSPD